MCGLPLQTRYRKYAEVTDGVAHGFATPTRKIELYSETLPRSRLSALPDFEEPLVSPLSRPDLAARYPLILTCSKSAQFCESQHRALPSLRKRARDPEVELHPDAAAARGIEAGDWVMIETPEGSVRARARLNESLAPGVVCGQHGWWQACPQLGAPAYDPFSADGANLNLIISNAAIDPNQRLRPAPLLSLPDPARHGDRSQGGCRPPARVQHPVGIRGKSLVNKAAGRT